MDKFRVGIFTQPRWGYRVWWSRVSLYKALGFKRAKDTPGGFVQHYLAAWQRSADSYGCENGFARSLQYANDVKANGRDDDRVLRFIACNSMALLCVLCKWAFLKKEGGGLGSGAEKLSTSNFLERLLHYCCQDGRFAFSLETTDLDANKVDQESRPVTITADANAKLNLGKLKDEVSINLSFNISNFINP